MTELKSLGKPFYACLIVLTCLGTIGGELYSSGLEHATGSPASREAATDSAEVANTREASPANTVRVVVRDITDEARPMPEPMLPHYELAGAVRSSRGEALEGARLRVVLVQGEAESELSQLVTDETGSFASELAELERYSPESLLSARLELRALAPGYQPLHRRLSFQDASTLRSVELRLESGQNLAGRVVDHKGRPVAGASVEMYLQAPPGTPRSEARKAITTDARGEFVLGWGRGFSPRFVDAKHDSFGETTRSLDRLAADEDHSIEDLALDPGGTLTGRVTCKHGGAALPGVRIDAQPYDKRLGSRRKWTNTGEDGAFSISGLLPGRYSLWIGDSSEPIGIWETGTQDLELEVDLVRLVVSVRDPRGNPLPGQRIDFVNIAGFGPDVSPLIETSTDVTRGPSALATFGPHREPRGESGRRASELDVAVRATSVTLPTVEELVAIPEDACRIDHTFTLLPPDRFGRLHVRLRRPDGEWLEDLEVQLASTLSRKPVSNLLDRDDSPANWMSLVPPGSYVLEVKPLDWTADDNFVMPIEDLNAIEVEPGRDTQVELTARLGGRIRLAIVTQEPPDVPRDEWPDRTAVVNIAPEDQKIEMHEAPTLVFVRDGDALGEFPIRSELSSLEVLEPGRYRVRVTCDEFQSEEFVLTVHAGRATRRAVELHPW